MSIRPILAFPDKRLREKATNIFTIDDPIRQLAQDMISTMRDASGIGLAANQVGVLKRIFVMNCSTEGNPAKPYVFINPAIATFSKEKETESEGCLSFPEMTADVTRSSFVEVKFQDIDGNWHQEHFEGIESRCIQHEIDHLNGKLFIDRTSLVKRRIIIQKMNKLYRLQADN